MSVSRSSTDISTFVFGGLVLFSAMSCAWEKSTAICWGNFFVSLHIGCFKPEMRYEKYARGERQPENQQISKRRMYTRRHTLNPYSRCNARPNHDPHSISQSNVHVPPLMERVHERERINWSEEFMIQRSLSTCITFANRDNSDTGLLDFPVRR